MKIRALKEEEVQPALTRTRVDIVFAGAAKDDTLIQGAHSSQESFVFLLMHGKVSGWHLTGPREERVEKYQQTVKNLAAAFGGKLV